eukprot:Pompholyxophrys_sp_v1_NODE_69_length_2496_cov_1.709136.p2 type:complete len:240 gc:universal NODE_69_length_2496_cov_1.709136:880-1599(+)
MELLLFDVDGTLVEASKNIGDDMINELLRLCHYYHIGIVGGGKHEKILSQTEFFIFDHVFSECGSVYHQMNDKHIYTKNIRNHPFYDIVDKMIKIALKYLSGVDYRLTGHFIDLRNGLVYVSMIGMDANDEERNMFVKKDEECGHRKKLIELMSAECGMGIKVVEGGSVGIAIYPTEWDKIQVMDVLHQYNTVHYFGDKYTETGNDYFLLNHPKVIGHCVDTPNDTLAILREMQVDYYS